MLPLLLVETAVNSFEPRPSRVVYFFIFDELTGSKLNKPPYEAAQTRLLPIEIPFTSLNEV